MNDQQILKIFYEHFIVEAQKGKIDCYFRLNIMFDVIINNIKISECIDILDDDILIPTLKITNQKLFEEKLVTYVNKAITFYDHKDFEFLNDVDDSFSVKENYLIKYILGTLFANASFNDFANPIDFLNSRIAMFDNKILPFEGERELGYLQSIGAKIYLKEEVSPIKTETPYRIKSYLQFDDGYQLFLPIIYAGNNGKEYTLYAIQKNNKIYEENQSLYLKQIRKGLIAKMKGAPEHYFLAVMLLLALCKEQEIEIIPFLVERWNAKRLASINKASRDASNSIIDMENEQNKIQKNITDTLILYFKKIEEVSEGMDFTALPYELDANLHLKISSHFKSRNIIFNELFALVNEFNNKNNLSR